MTESFSADEQVATNETLLLSKLEQLGGRAGNITLQRELQWDLDAYWQVRDRLVDSGRLALGRGKGGSVSLVPPVPDAGGVEPQCDDQQPSPDRLAEKQLYGPVAEVIRTQLASDLRFGKPIVEITANQGRKGTGGTWTRPDIVMASLRVFPHVPGKFFDLVSFEIKPLDGIDITAVFEALAHRRAATQSYIWLHVPAGEDLPNDLPPLLQRIEDEAARYGIGMIVGATPADYSTWDIRLRAVRHDPDPETMNEFIAQQISMVSRDLLAQWFR
ncbi:MAG: hypothetical protein KJZ79_02490 [Bryobacteraceae bacterium]|nr:hypothetical protein [Bryobacteraceae bacterium]